MWVKQCHHPPMTGNGLYHLSMVNIPSIYIYSWWNWDVLSFFPTLSNCLVCVPMLCTRAGSFPNRTPRHHFGAALRPKMWCPQWRCNFPGVPWLLGGFKPSEKYEFVSWDSDDDSQHLWNNKQKTNYFASSDPHHGIQFIPSDNLSGISNNPHLAGGEICSKPPTSWGWILVTWHLDALRIWVWVESLLPCWTRRYLFFYWCTSPKDMM